MLYIRDIRKSRHMTMKELGKKIGVSESAVQLYETGKRRIDYELMLKISEALDCEVLDLFHGFETPPEPEEIPCNPPDEVADIWNAWDKMDEADKAIIRVIGSKYK